MTDIKIKLNDIVSPKQIGSKRRGPIHILNNSLKRNTILGANSFSKHLSYEAKLPHIHLPRKDISHMLKYLLKKEQMNIPDKNLVRRILVNSLDEDLISEGSQQFVNHIEIMEGKQGDIAYPGHRKFYMILKGQVIIKTQNIQYRRYEGETFGELEIISGSQIQELWFQKHSLMVTMEQQHYQSYFAPRFNSIYCSRQAELLCMSSILNAIPLFSKFLFLSTCQERVYKLGDKIVEKGQPIERMYVVADRLKQQRLQHLTKGCVGLYEFQLSLSVYQETVFCPFNDMKVIYFHKDDFNAYVYEFWNTSKIMHGSSIIEKSMMLKSAISMTNPEDKVVNFMRIKRVKLPNKRSNTEAYGSIESQFRFLKDHNNFTPSKTTKKLTFDTVTQTRKKNFSLCLKKPPRTLFHK